MNAAKMGETADHLRAAIEYIEAAIKAAKSDTTRELLNDVADGLSLRADIATSAPCWSERSQRSAIGLLDGRIAIFWKKLENVTMTDIQHARNKLGLAYSNLTGEGIEKYDFESEVSV